MTDLSEFLLARFAEDESEARKAGDRFGGGPWEYDGNYNVAGHPPFGGPVRASVQDPSIGRHVARWDPNRVLAECEAKRAIVEARQMIDAHVRQVALADQEGARDARNTRAGLDVALKALALPYASHPDYDESWKP